MRKLSLINSIKIIRVVYDRLQIRQHFLNSIKWDFEIWAQWLKKKWLSEADLKFLIEGKKDLAQIILLKHAGIAEIKIDKFRNGIIDIVCIASEKDSE